MNLSHIKKMGEDEDFWHVQDARDGSAFKVAKKGLSATLHGQIAQHFYDGGEAERAATWAKEHPGQDVMSDQFPGLSAKERFDAMEGAKPQGDGFNPSVAFQAVKDWAHTDAPEYTPPATNFTPAPPPTDPGPQPDVNMSPVGGFTPAPPETPAPPAAPPPPTQPMPGTGGGGLPSGGAGVPSYDKDLMKSAQAQKDANTASVKVAEDRAKAELEAQAAYQQKAAETQQLWADRLNQNLSQQEQLKQDLASGKINPEGWWSSRDTGQKIAGTIGLILGGIGQAFGGGENQAKILIDKAIASDIDAQKANLGKKQTLLGDLMQQGHSLQEAEKLASAHDLAVFQGQMQKAATQFAGPERQADAMKINAGIDTQRIKDTQASHERGFQDHIELAKLDLERAKIAAASSKAGTELPPEAAKINNQLTALSDTVKLAKQHGKTGPLETLVPFGTTPSNVYSEDIKARAENIAAGKLPLGKETPAAVEHEIASLPTARQGRALARENFKSTWDAIHRNATAQIQTLEAGGKYDKAQLADMRQKLKAAEAEAAAEGLSSGGGNRVSVVGPGGVRGTMDIAELAKYPQFKQVGQ